MTIACLPSLRPIYRMVVTRSLKNLQSTQEGGYNSTEWKGRSNLHVVCISKGTDSDSTKQFAARDGDGNCSFAEAIDAHSRSTNAIYELDNVSWESRDYHIRLAWYCSLSTPWNCTCTLACLVGYQHIIGLTNTCIITSRNLPNWRLWARRRANWTENNSIRLPALYAMSPAIRRILPIKTQPWYLHSKSTHYRFGVLIPLIRLYFDSHNGHDDVSHSFSLVN
jgi:hypothetical protein